MLHTIVITGIDRYDETILSLEKAVLQDSERILIKLIHTAPLPSYIALTIYSILKNRNSQTTTLITSAYTPVVGPAAFLWLLGDVRLMNPESWLCLPLKKIINKEEGVEEYKRVLHLCGEYLYLTDNIDKILDIDELNQLGLVSGSPLDVILNKKNPTFS